MRLILLFFIPVFPLMLNAQDFKISGQVRDGSNGEPLGYATVSVLQSSDSSLVTGVVSGTNGNFSVSVPAGNYLVRIQFVTYKTKNIGGVRVNNNHPEVSLGSVEMMPSQTELAEVVVQAERTQMELQLDKKVYNVGKDLSNLGGSASDLLGNLPSVTVDVDGNVNLRGSSSVKILIDGKPSGLVGLSSTDALRQMQGSLIERVEIITNPSARYDAEGMAGIINIVLKKEKKNGVNGSFQLNTGYPHNHGASVNMNFRQKWVNLFVNYGVDYRRAPGYGGSFQQYRNPDTLFYDTDLERNSMRGGLSNNIRFGADFYLGEKSTLTTSFLYRYSNELNETDLTYRDYSLSGELLNYTLREDTEKEGDENLEYALNYTKEFAREGHKLTADIQYQNNNELERSDIVQSEGTTSGSAVPALMQKVRNDEGEERWMFQADYIQPFSLKGKIEAGFRSTIRNVRNNYLVQQQNVETGEYIRLDSFSTDFSYNENVHAVYGIVSNETDKISWQLGLRSETTDINALQSDEGEDRKLRWNYTNFFPSAFFTYKLKMESQLQLSYSRRINRPRFRELNPFSSFTDNRNFRVGNPQLQPEFTDSYEFGLLQNMSKSSIYYGVYYRHTNQLIQRVTLQPNELGQRTSIPYNIGYQDALGLEANVAHQFGEWYRVSGNFNFYTQQTRGHVGDSISLAAKAVSFSTRISNNFKLNDWFDAQLNVNYRAPETQTQGRRLSMTTVDIGLSKDIWNKNGTVSLSVRDLFNTRKWRSVTDLDYFYEKSTWQWRKGPTFNLSLTYRLNQKKERGGDRDEFDDEGSF